MSEKDADNRRMQIKNCDVDGSLQGLRTWDSPIYANPRFWVLNLVNLYHFVDVV